MSQTYYLPRTDKDKAIWLKNFSAKFNGYATGLGFVAADATAIAADSAAFSYIIDQLEIFKTESKERTAYKDKLAGAAIGSPLGALPTIPTLPAAPASVPAGIFTRISGTVKRIKGHPSYNEAIGKDLGIIGTVAATPGYAKIVSGKPTITLAINGGKVEVKYKKGDAEGIQLFSKRGNETEFSLLSVVTKHLYTDKRPNLTASQPEKREYLAYYMQDDEPIGQSSDSVSVVI